MRRDEAAMCTHDKKKAFHLPAILGKRKPRFIFLQGLISIILSYELLLSPQTLLSFEAEQGLAIGLWILTAALLRLPVHFFQATWFVGGLLLADTGLTVAAIYISGNASAHLFTAFFLLILVAASARKLVHMLALSLLVCAGYGLVLYQGIIVSGVLAFGHLMGIPVLLVMALFYGLTIQTLVGEREQKIELAERLSALRWEEAELHKARQDLELQIEGMNEELSRVNEALRLGRVRQEGLELRVRRAHKMEAVARVAGVIGQEFEALLRAIGIQGSRLLQRFDQNDPARRHVDRILAAGDRASVLTGQLQLFSQQDSIGAEAVPLNLTVERLQGLVLGLVHNGTEVQLVLDPSVGYVKADRGQLEWVIVNLVASASDAMPRGGQLTVETSLVGSDELPVPCGSDDATRQFVRLAVSDSGIGVSADMEARLFEPFFSPRGHAGGGGLASVYAIVKRSGGTIEVKSRPGRGTTYHVFLESVVHRPRSLDDRARTRGAPNGDTTILLVEEEEVFRKLSLAELEQLDFRVLEARTPVEALVLAQRYVGSIHLVVSNAMMHDINGRELTRRLLLQHPCIKIIYMGGYPHDVYRDWTAAGAGFLQKPCTQRDLVEKVREVLAT